MSRFKMCWPDLSLEVRCENIDINKKAFEVLKDNMPVKVVQSHEMTGGWMLRDRSVLLGKRYFNISASEMTEEVMASAPVGRISLLMPIGSSTELVVKYDECVDTREYIPVAQVVQEDLPILYKAGKEQWKSATRLKNIIFVEFLPEED